MPRSGRGRRGRGYGGAGLATWSGENECHRCGEDIKKKSDGAVTSKGKFVHKKCMAGATDE